MGKESLTSYSSFLAISASTSRQQNPNWGTQAMQSSGVSLPGYRAGLRMARAEFGAVAQVENTQHKGEEKQRSRWSRRDRQTKRNPVRWRV